MGRYLNNDIEFSSGVGKFIHLLTWPIRKFYIVIPLLTLIYVTPIFFDVKPNEVHRWYGDRFAELGDKAMEYKFIKTPVEKISSWFSVEEETFASPQKPKIKKAKAPMGDAKSKLLVDMPKPKTQVYKRKSFDKAAKVVPVEVKGIEEVAYSDDAQNISDVEIVTGDEVLTIGSLPNSSTQVSDLINVERKSKSLVYLRVPKDIQGKAEIINANEIKVDGAYILLYGIYVNPNTVVGQDAMKYLQEWTNNKEVKCSVVAYTFQNVATAVCFVGEENLNKTLIRMDLTKNVAL
ncbi:MAG: hypothetical protein PHE89_05365 [Alphaproteobacteria bacterium]|nr:hypothetical protein [Alphaproteobacteria bacterium]